MPDSVSSASVPTVRATLERAGRTDRPKVSIPDDDRDRFPAGEVVRLLVDGKTRHATVERAIDDTLEIRGVYDNARLARDGEGDNRLPEWTDDARLDFGRSVLLDVLDEGFAYGLRAPGEEQVYHVPDRPDGELASIADEVVPEDAEAEGTADE